MSGRSLIEKVIDGLGVGEALFIVSANPEYRKRLETEMQRLCNAPYFAVLQAIRDGKSGVEIRLYV